MVLNHMACLPLNIWKASSICKSLKALRALHPSSLAFL